MQNFKWLLILLSQLVFSQIKTQAYSKKQIDSIISATYSKSNIKKAVKDASEAYRLSDEMGYGYGKMRALYSVVNINIYTGNNKKAIEYANQLEKIASEENNYLFQVFAWGTKASAYAYLGFFKEADSSLKTAESLSKNLKGDDFYYAMGDVYKRHAEIEEMRGSGPEIILKYDLKSFLSCEKIKNVYRRITVTATQAYNLGSSYSAVGKPDSALYYSRKAYSLSLKAKNPNDIAFGLMGIAEAFKNVNKNDSALYYYNKALPLFLNLKQDYQQQYIYEDLSSIYENLGESKTSLYYTKKAKDLAYALSKKEKGDINGTYEYLLEDNNRKKKNQFYYILILFFSAFVVILFFAGRIFKKYHTERKQKEETSQYITEKEEQISQLQDRINDISKEVLELAQNNDPSFLVRFKDAYPKFSNTIEKTFPEINKNDFKLCAFLKLNFSNKDIATYTHVNVSTVEIRKNRFRKKYNLPPNSDILSFLENDHQPSEDSPTL
ncbi:tetratricopeptide repeat protein [Chryseobacterium gambrini]|uniref:Tetratricopeptide repeat protein n=1 Tax=Chryseobacterium gambrini TaxID=373672 RepID=A0AAJ1R6U5_9FLAO|nr:MULTISPECIES: tetratricopeptide repeat protein [Chryseobacterium]MDN4014773.1 tetratricopeptide repeat protein [Chryseobacterium gambrini]MDN4031880.1 tetratricopeptide repeat protein [Chryseobacterium gambrini]QWA39664.1 tetratricopeptide repeat protein [Chryseobacterium sp. ZHDP1]